MNSIQTLLAITDAYKIAAGIPFDRTVSHRVFGDSKKISALREGADITTRRLDAAMIWFADNWPDGVERPEQLRDPSVETKEDAA